MEKIRILEDLTKKYKTDLNISLLLALEYEENNYSEKALNIYKELEKRTDKDKKEFITNKISELSPNNNKENRISIFKDLKGKITFDDVGGSEYLKKILMKKIIKPFKSNSTKATFNKNNSSNILLYGPPQCGKGFIAKATAEECGAKFLSINIIDIINEYNNGSIFDFIFEKVKEEESVILYIRNIDKLSKLSNKMVESFYKNINLLDNDKALIIASSNLPWDIDKNISSLGNFETLIFVSPPDKEARESIFKLKLYRKPIDENINYRHLSRKTENFSTADIEKLISKAGDKVFEDFKTNGIERKINMKDLLNSISATHPVILDWSRDIDKFIEKFINIYKFEDLKKFLDKV